MVLAIIESNCFANQKYLMIKYGPFFLPRVYIYCCESYEKTILVNFCRCITESIFAHFTIVTNITVWYSNCSVLDQKALQRVLKTAQGIAGTPLSATEAVQYITVSAEGVQGHLSPQSQTVSPLLSRRHYTNLCSTIGSLRNSFFPSAVSCSGAGLVYSVFPTSIYL